MVTGAASGVVVAAVTGTVPIAVTVVATLVVVALLASVVSMLRSARELRRAAEALEADMRQTLDAIDGTLADASAELRRVDDLIGSAESITDTVGSASRLAYLSVANPLIKVMALGRGTSRAGQRLMSRGR